jgi:hypothetical protein
MKIVRARANKIISGDFFFIFKFDKINSAKLTNAGIFYNCQNEGQRYACSIHFYLIDEYRMEFFLHLFS